MNNMKKRTLWIAALLGGCSLSGFAQQAFPEDMSGDKAYKQVCKEYAWKGSQSLPLLQAYLDQYPDSRYANRVMFLMASAYYDDGKFAEAIAMFRSCNLEALPNADRDTGTLRLATAYLKTNNLREAAVWFRTLKEVSKKYQRDAVYHLAYIDYVEQRREKALAAFRSLETDDVYGELVPYYIGELELQQGNARGAAAVAERYLERYPISNYRPEMERILGEARFALKDYYQAIAPLEHYCEAVARPQRKAWYLLGMSHYQVGAYSKATEALGWVTTMSDALAQNAYLHQGLAYLQLKERNRARLAFEQASLTDFDRNIQEQALYNYALCIHETSYSPFAESVKVFERFLNQFPGSRYVERVNDYLIEVYLNTRSYEAALQSIAQIERPGPRILQAKQQLLYRLGTEKFANADFQGAIDAFNRSLALGSYDQPTKADAYYWRGESYYRLNQYAQAEQDMRQFLEWTNRPASEEQYLLAYYDLGYIFFKQQRYDQALPWFQKMMATPQAVRQEIGGDALNRIGDCHFHNRRFAEASQAYAQAANLYAPLGDYSLYQEGLVRGLQRDYNGKIQVLNRLLQNYPESSYMDEALYEQGRAFVQLEDNPHAIDRFRILVQRYPGSPMARRAANEIGLLYYQDDKYPEAIEAYKQVIADYPGSEEARQAQRDLKSIYIDLNQVDAYAAYAASLPGGVSFDASERDSLTYVAAERIYMRGDFEAARNSLVRYLQTFPEGAFSLQAHYYIGAIDCQRQATAEAMEHLDKVLAYPDNKYSEEAMRLRADLAFQTKDYAKALQVYRLWTAKATNETHRQTAWTGVLRSARQLKDADAVLEAAIVLLADAKLSPEVAAEVRYDRAKVYLESGKPEAAQADWKELAQDTRTVYGAEAKYRIAQQLFDTGQAEAAERELLHFIEVSTPHAYWLARSFVLLSDVYHQLGRDLDARQYLLSLQQNYQADDDIAGMIQNRLEKLKSTNN